MHSESIAYQADGLGINGELYFDPSVQGLRPAVLVFPEAFGLGEHALSRARGGLARLAPAAGPVSAKTLVCVGADDPSIDAAQRTGFKDEMRESGADWRLHVYGGVVHSLTSRAAHARGKLEFARYDTAADGRSWSAMLELFGEIMPDSRPT